MGKQYQYQALHKTIKEHILKGIYKPGDLLPSENELLQIYNLSKSTVRQALLELQKDRLIEKKHGRGSVVLAQDHRDSLGILSVKSFSQAVGERQETIKSIFVVRPELRPWPSNFFYSLPEEYRRKPAVYFERVRMVNDDPVMLEITYLPSKYIPKITEKPFVKDSLFETLVERYDLIVKVLDQDLRAEHAEASVAKLLKIKEGQAILHVLRRYHSQVAEFKFYSMLFCNTTLYAMGNTFR